MSSDSESDLGTVLNDHYSIEDYVQRRVGWLARQPGYEKLTGLYPTTQEVAKVVFGLDYKLSVQKVHHREQCHGIKPLLPLPTTKNTETINNFADYPAEEWTPDADDSDSSEQPLTSARKSATGLRALSSRKADGRKVVDGDVKTVGNTGRTAPTPPSRPNAATNSALKPKFAPKAQAANTFTSTTAATATTTTSTTTPMAVGPIARSAGDIRRCPVPGCNVEAPPYKVNRSFIASHLQNDHGVPFPDSTRAPGGNEYGKNVTKAEVLAKWFKTQGIALDGSWFIG